MSVGIYDPVPWSFAHADPEEARLVLPVIAELWKHLDQGAQELGRKPEPEHYDISPLQAHWITRIRIAAPSLGLWEVWLLAHGYIVALARQKPTRELDAQLVEASRGESA